MAELNERCTIGDRFGHGQEPARPVHGKKLVMGAEQLLGDVGVDLFPVGAGQPDHLRVQPSPDDLEIHERVTTDLFGEDGSEVPLCHRGLHPPGHLMDCTRLVICRDRIELLPIWVY